MTDSTQLADQFLLQSSLKTDSSVKVSRGKSVAIVNDGQSGSYSSGIVSFDCQSALNGSTGYASLKDAYIVLPFVCSMKNTDASTAPGLSAGDYPSRYALGMKCNIANVIDEVKVYLNGKSIITHSEYKQLWSNVRAMAKLTTAEVEKHGADMFLYPDDWDSTHHSSVASFVGDGYSNNHIAGNSSLTLVSGEPVRSNTGFQRNNNPRAGWAYITAGEARMLTIARLNLGSEGCLEELIARDIEVRMNRVDLTDDEEEAKEETIEEEAKEENTEEI
jgi:hypothetical protein